MVRYVVALFALSTLGLALVPIARAQNWNNPGVSIQQQSALVWRQMSVCAQQAAIQYKDHTPEGNAKREAARLDCLRRNHLPITTEPRPYY
jgi:hypothetical protein